MDKSFTIDLKYNINGTPRTKEDLLQLLELLKLNSIDIPEAIYNEIVIEIQCKINSYIENINQNT